MARRVVCDASMANQWRPGNDCSSLICEVIFWLLLVVWAAMWWRKGQNWRWREKAASPALCLGLVDHPRPHTTLVKTRSDLGKFRGGEHTSPFLRHCSLLLLSSSRLWINDQWSSKSEQWKTLEKLPVIATSGWIQLLLLRQPPPQPLLLLLRQNLKCETKVFNEGKPTEKKEMGTN